MEHHFTLSGTTLTVHLPSELDHCSSQQLRQEIDRLIRGAISAAFYLILEIQNLWTAPESECC